MSAGRQGWIVSPRVDLLALGVPFAAALLLALVPQGPEQTAPLWAFLLLIVAFDVSHVWATLYLGYLDREVFRRRRLLLLLMTGVVAGYAANSAAYGFWPILFISIFTSALIRAAMPVGDVLAQQPVGSDHRR